MDEKIEQLYQIEIEAEQSLSTINDKKLNLKDKYNGLQKKYQEQAEQKFNEEFSTIKKQYEQEKEEQLKKIKTEFDSHSKQIHQIFEHEQEHYVERFMNTVKKLGENDNE